MFNPRITGSYPSTNSAYREQVLEQYDITNISDDHSEVNTDGMSNVSQPPVGPLPDVHLVDNNQQLVIVPFNVAWRSCPRPPWQLTNSQI